MTNTTITLSKEEFSILRDRSLMLGVIAGYVEAFCEEEETPLMGVVRLLARYHEESARNLCYVHTQMQKGKLS
jgi:hypothetical protein